MPERVPTIAVVGAGGRGSTYASWIQEHPDRARVVAVADPNESRRERLADAHQVPVEGRFRSWQDLVAAGRVADAAIVATQDADHVGPVEALADAGYHLLLEKPMAPSVEGCERIVKAATSAGVMLAVCHVMRYMPYTRLLRKVLDSGRIGDVVNVQHLEPVGYWHQAHSYVRGNWRREDEASFMLLAKSCHDIDWLRYVVGRPINRVSSFGGLAHFRSEHKPDGAGDRCLDCGVEADCPYSAKRFYLGRLGRGETGWPVSVITEDVTEQGVRQALADGPYGRCVYSCDNDVVDHQVVALEFDGGVAATFTMTAFSQHGHRRTQIFGTRGCIDGDGEKIVVSDFRTDTEEVLEISSLGSDAGAGHGGGDQGLVDAFTAALRADDPSLIRSGPQESLETHLAVFAAERARRSGTVETV
ncbi:MAG TPA: Gfo/Idh/MocA family oxidoreductase [Mycobacteriales bacterium]|nr:Gfo/Idh/MocA family oxidoreductase [Mycobacteriales bacterium]